MARVKRSVAARKRRKRILKKAKGYYGGRSKLFGVAREAVEKAAVYAYVGRKQRKRQFRALWIMRINAAAREHGLTYGRFIDGLTKAGVGLNRKMLSEIAIHDAEAFTKIVGIAKEKIS